jgi:hypothetical protein
MVSIFTGFDSLRMKTGGVHCYTKKKSQKDIIDCNGKPLPQHNLKMTVVSHTLKNLWAQEWQQVTDR